MLVLTLGVALAAVPFGLPPGEDAEDWAPALALAGFEPGAASGGSSARIVVEGATWRLVVIDEDGRVHTAPITPAHTRQEREDVAWFARSLVDPVIPPFGSGGGAGAPEPARQPRPSGEPRPSEGALSRQDAPRQVRPADATPPAEVAAAAPVEPVVEPADVGPVEVLVETPVDTSVDTSADTSADTPADTSADTSTAPSAPLAAGPGADPTPEAPPRLRAWVGLGGAVNLRGGLAAAPAGELALGLERGGWGATLLVGTQAPAVVDTGGLADASAAAERARVLAGGHLAGPVAPSLALGGGLSRYRFEQDGQEVAAAWVAGLVGEVGLRFRLGHPGGVGVELDVAQRLGWDSRRARIAVEGAPAGTWSPWTSESVLRLALAWP